MPRGRHASSIGPARLALVLFSSLAFVLAMCGLGGGLASASQRATAHRAESQRASGRSSTAKVRSGGFATYALPVGENFAWMLPLEDQAHYEDYDSNVEGGMWLPLYWAGIGSHTGIDYHLSVGQAPVYSNGDRTVSITLNSDYRWSDGTKVTTADVKLFFELEAAGKNQLGNYLPGLMPDNIKSVSYPSSTRFVMHLIHPYGPTWFTGNQLTWIYPLPAQKWNKTCTSCAIGHAATTPAGAKKVISYLFKQSKNLGTYATNPLWKVVDGPWVIKSYQPTTHTASFSKNKHYSGPTPAHLAGYKILSFTTGTPELNALRSGTLTFGWIPDSEVSETSYFKSHGYSITSWPEFYNETAELGYTSKKWGPLVKQLYIRQALQHLITQKLYINRALHGYGIESYGTVAVFRGSDYLSPTMRKDPYPYNLQAAAKLLSSHGWVRHSGGTFQCSHPGTGNRECGKGISKGEPLSLSFMYSTGDTGWFAEVSAFRTAARAVGIDVTLNPQVETTMFSIAGTCPAAPPCNWGIAGYAGFMWDYGQYQLVPLGENQFGKGNFWAGGYTSPTLNKLIHTAETKPGRKHLYAAENYITKQVASLWFPLGITEMAVKGSLHGWQSLSPYANQTPRFWYFS